tara:strand:+ start:18785 stop:19768 length:984 start_codon:yes stop_codon:yes gene_type:complete
VKSSTLALMTSLSHKAKQYLLTALKVFILAITFGYIYVKLTSGDGVDLDGFKATLASKDNIEMGEVLFFVFLTIINWTFEILKWQTLVLAVQNISFTTALKQSLASLTVSLATPNRIGEYGAKAYFFVPSKRKQVLLLNFVGNMTQMIITTLFGIIGLCVLVFTYNISFSWMNIILLGAGVIVLSVLVYIFKEKELLLKGLSISKVVRYIKGLSTKIKLRVLVFSLIRYATFCFLFYRLMLFFGAGITFEIAIFMIMAMYLLVSVIPTLFIFDVVIRSGVAVWLFSLAGTAEIIVLCTVFAMWILNFVVPSIVGSFYVISHKSAVKC